MSIATRQGDDGNTSLFGGRRVPKDDLRVEAYGAVDELNAALGCCRALGLPEDLDRLVVRLQSELFDLGADLATPREENPKADRVQPFSSAILAAVDRDLEEVEGRLPPLTTFILPGGHPAAAWLHFCRTLCRRAERRVVTLARHERLSGTVLRYLNRLSDLLFLLARDVNLRHQVPEPIWKPREERPSEEA